MDELIAAIVKPLVNFPEDIQVSSENSEDGITYILTVNKEDMGKVIGKKGRIAGAIRTIVHAAGRAQHQDVQLSIRE
ncbi:RNA-binding protein with KH domain [Scopulibacillus darangshiensis]|uniref:RNA-binding protein KhpA n=1 Tax=Scopulibacillus darangshiensis TaxID=442528 RepID=A0A4R2P5U5_9BACL|nr:KH domain-containing protein [Scopulibacillus darangshiensis]TCP29155.1 RNA-binding protein with KH domain [Scopulibacillus darangshiensis]